MRNCIFKMFDIYFLFPVFNKKSTDFFQQESKKRKRDHSVLIFADSEKNGSVTNWDKALNKDV